jgi:ankyrin repeat protein
MPLLEGQRHLLRIPNNEGQLPLHVAATSGVEDTALALLRLDPSTAVMGDRRGLTAAQLAAQSGHQVRY